MVYETTIIELRLRSNIDAIPTHGEMPKVTFPKNPIFKDGLGLIKKKYLFVDFEHENPETGKIISREFIKQFNKKFGQNVAQCAKVIFFGVLKICFSYFKILVYGCF